MTSFTSHAEALVEIVCDGVLFEPDGDVWALNVPERRLAERYADLVFTSRPPSTSCLVCFFFFELLCLNMLSW